MIRYIQYEEEYDIQIYDLIKNIMQTELEIDCEKLISIISDLKNIKYNYLERGGNFWIAIDTKTDKVVGTVGILKIDTYSAEFKRFYVKENYRGKHIGSKLYEVAENYAQNNNILNLYLVSGDKSKRAKDIYYKMVGRLQMKKLIYL